MSPLLSFVIGVKVTDAAGLTSQGSVSITVVKSNNRPIISTATFTTPENVPIGTVMGTVVASDRDVGQGIAYSIISGDSLGVFSINSVGSIAVAKAVLDFETTPRFDLTVQVLDNDPVNPPLAATAIIVVQLTNVNEVP